MTGYYSQHLSAERLQRCYDLAGPRIRQYLEAEIEFVIQRIQAPVSVLELGCGYGRVLSRLIPHCSRIAGIDTSLESLLLARETIASQPPPVLAAMDASRMGLCDEAFDVTICIQNGICAFGVDPSRLITEAVRVTRPGGRVLFSSYSRCFWGPRLEWFERQSAEGLLGEIDYEATDGGVIVCRDGFHAATMDGESFQRLASELSLTSEITEVDSSSVFCEIPVPVH